MLWQFCACGGAPAQPTTAPLVAAATSAAKATDAPATLTPATPATKTSAATPTDAPKPAPTKENEIAQINFSEMLKNVEKVLKEAGIPYSIAVSDTYTVAGHTIQSVGYASLGAPDKGTPLTVARKAQNQELLTRGLDEWVKEGHSLDDLMIEGVPLKGVRYVLYINAGTFDDGKKVADAINKSNALPHNLSAQGGAWGFEDENWVCGSGNYTGSNLLQKIYKSILTMGRAKHDKYIKKYIKKCRYDKCR